MRSLEVIRPAQGPGSLIRTLVFLLPGVTLVFVVLQRQELMAPDIPVWVPTALLAVAGTAILVLDKVFVGGSPSQEALRVCCAATGVWTTIYVTGWGAAIAPGCLAWVAIEINWRGPAGARWRIASIPLGMACGQALIALGLVPTLISDPEVHGLAVLTGGLTTFGAILMERAAGNQHAAQEALHLSEDRFRSIVQSIADLVLVVDERLFITYASPASRTVAGLEPEELAGTSALDFIHPDDVARTFDALQESLSSSHSAPAALLRGKHADGSWRWIEIAGTNLGDDPAVGGIVVNVRDVTVRQNLELQLSQLAYYDSLTKLPNRRAFADRAEQAIARAARQEAHLAVLFVDLDGFKPINDTLGHEIGDQILERVGERLKFSVRAEDTVARLGGDEFTILVEDLRYPHDTSEIARRVITAQGLPLVVQGHQLVVTASVGIAAWNPDDPITVDELLRRADVAMYVAKSKGKSRFEFYEGGTHEGPTGERRRTELLPIDVPPVGRSEHRPDAAPTPSAADAPATPGT